MKQQQVLIMSERGKASAGFFGYFGALLAKLLVAAVLIAIILTVVILA